MKSFRKFFHQISYLQYPLLAVSLLYVLKPYFNGFEMSIIVESYNKVLIYMGLAISFSTLQDTTKTQNEFSRKIWEHPVKGRVAIWILASSILLIITLSLLGIYAIEESLLNDLSVGLLVFGIGLIGMLKAATEMFEYRQSRKK